MNKRVALLIAFALAACGSSTSPSLKGGGLPLGPQHGAITLAAGSNYDVDIPGGNPSPVLRFATNASGSTLNGLNSAYYAEGDVFWIRNDGASGTLTIVDEDTGNAVGSDQFLTPSTTSIALIPHQQVQVEFDHTAGKFVASPNATSSNVTGNETKTSGAASLTVKTTYTSTTGTVAYTLPNGTFTGQQHCFEESTAASTPLGTVTITTPAGSELATHTMTAIGQRFCEEWSGTGWHMIDKHRAGQQAVVVGTTVLTGLDMAAEYALSVTGTVSSTTTKGIPNGGVAGEIIHIMVPTAASTPSGTISITSTTIATGVAATSLSGINATTVQAGFLWDGASWQNTALTTATNS